MYSTVEGMDGCECSTEITIVAMTERIAGTNLFWK